MKTLISITFACLLILGGAPDLRANETNQTPAPQKATGVVFHDRNRNGTREAGEEGIPNIRVSNQQQVVLTDGEGRYELPVSDDMIVFVIKPRGWMTPVSEDRIPKFYYIHKPGGSPKTYQYKGVSPTGPLPQSIDFPLHPQAEPEKFRMVLFGDTQPRDQHEIDYIAHDVVEELVGIDAAFGMTLGDVVFDDLSLFEGLNRTVAAIGIPWYNVPGNHDLNYDSRNNELADETWERVYGPSYYSFDHGPVHFIVLNDVEWSGSTPRVRGNYKAKLGQKQLEFLRNDLSHVPAEQLVVLTMHIPVIDIEDRAELYSLLADRTSFSISAHTHYQRHIFLTEKDGWTGAKPHHHLNHATVAGSWWSGGPDENGIPHTTMRDGSPNGYSIITFEGSGYSIEFKAARRPAPHQMNIYAPEVISSAESASIEVLANVFAGSERSKVEMRIRGHEGSWRPLLLRPQPDPYYVGLKMLENSSTPPPGRRLPRIAESAHIWSGRLPANLRSGTQVIEVRTTDMFGQTYTARRIIRVR